MHPELLIVRNIVTASLVQHKGHIYIYLIFKPGLTWCNQT